MEELEIPNKLEDLLGNNPKLRPFNLEETHLGQGDACISLKKEYDPQDPLRSIKRKPAYLLIADMLEKGYLRKKNIIISASSGNLGLEVGLEVVPLGYKYIVVTPSYTPKQKMELLTAIGIDVVKTEEEDYCPREFTVFLVRNIAERYRFQCYNLDQFIGNTSGRKNWRR